MSCGNIQATMARVTKPSWWESTFARLGSPQATTQIMQQRNTHWLTALFSDNESLSENWLANVSQTCGGMCTWSPHVYKAPTMRSTSSFSDNVKTSTPDMSGRHGRPRGLAIGRGNLQSAAHVACDVNNHMDREAKHVKTQLTIRCNKKLHQAIMQFNLR